MQVLLQAVVRQGVVDDDRAVIDQLADLVTEPRRVDRFGDAIQNRKRHGERRRRQMAQCHVQRLCRVVTHRGSATSNVSAAW